MLNIEKIGRFNIAQNTINALKELGAEDTFTFDEVAVGVIGDTEDEKQDETADKCTADMIAVLDSIGIDEQTICDFIGRDDDLSKDASKAVFDAVASIRDDDVIEKSLAFAKSEDNTTFDSITQDTTTMPERKNGYRRTLVVRNGKKTWVNKRMNGKRVILTPKQKMALRKARLKAHTATAKYKRKKSVTKRNQFGL